MSAPNQILEYMRSKGQGLPPNSKLRPVETEVGFTITQQLGNIWITVLLLSPIFVLFGGMIFGAAMDMRRFGFEPVILLLLLFPIAGTAVLFGIIHRRRIPSALAFVGMKMIVITPDQIRLRHEIIIDRYLRAYSRRTGLSLEGNWPGELVIEQSGRKICAVFRNTPEKELDWVASVVNSAIAGMNPV